MNIGLIGNDTSHAEIFSSILHDTTHPYYIENAQFVGFVEVYSTDFELSYSRAPKYNKILKNFGIRQYENIHSLAPFVDAWIIGTVDARNHLSLFKEIVSYSKPIFIDKPIVLSVEDFNEIVQLSTDFNTPFFSASSLRYSDLLTDDIKQNTIDFIYAYGPLPFETVMPGYYWYGIHSLEWIEELLQSDVISFDRCILEEAELLTMHFSNGKKVVFRGEYEWNDKFGGVIHQSGVPNTILFWESEKPYYASLLEKIITFFQTRESPLPIYRMKRVVQWIEKINQLLK